MEEDCFLSMYFFFIFIFNYNYNEKFKLIKKMILIY